MTTKDLTASPLHRQNVLNNPFALEQLQTALNLGGVMFEGELVFTKSQVATFFEVEERTIERMISEHGEELSKNGYRLLKSIKLNKFKELCSATDIDVGTKTTLLGIFTFKAVLNIGMLLTESEKAKKMRSRILDIVMQVITQKAGNTTYINQRAEDYLPSTFQEEGYRKGFTTALNSYVAGNQWKYKHCTDAIYKALFRECATEYRKILKLQKSDKVRETLYAEVLDMIASFEAGLPEVLQKAFEEKGDLLTVKEAVAVIEVFGQQSHWKPLITPLRTKMASRDLTFREALHVKLEAYIQAVPESDYEKFLGEKSKALEDRIAESLDVYKRLKDR